MKKIRKILVCFIVFAELMVVMQPVSALVKNNVSEKFNLNGNAKKIQIQEAKIKKLQETITQPIHELPNTSNSSIFLEDYLDHSKSILSKNQEGFKEVEKGLFNKNSQKEFKNEGISFAGILPDILYPDSPIRLEYGKTTVRYVPTGINFKSALVNQNSIVYYTDQRNTFFTYTLNTNHLKKKLPYLHRKIPIRSHITSM